MFKEKLLHPARRARVAERLPEGCRPASLCGRLLERIPPHATDSHALAAMRGSGATYYSRIVLNYDVSGRLDETKFQGT